ncbi:flavoprotein-like protein [Obelidium mucronatum]|nr:flavoprotein-like protein [Obelidium mucronatum]
MVLIGVLIGSVRPGRNGFRLAKFIQDELEKKHDVQVVLIDPLELNLPIVTGTYAKIKDSPDCPPALKELQKVFQSIDALLVVTPEYSHSYSPAVGNTLNYFRESEFYLKPAGVSTYTVGSFGGVRAEAAILPLFQSLGLVAIPKVFPVPYIHKALSEDGQVPDSTSFPTIRELFNAFADELIWTARALKTAKAHSPVDQEFKTVNAVAPIPTAPTRENRSAVPVLRSRESKVLNKVITTKTSTVTIGGVTTKTEVVTTDYKPVAV